MLEDLAVLLLGPWLIFTLFFIFLAILWTVLPFAIFGIKPRLEKLIKATVKAAKATEEQNALLAQLLDQQRGIPAREPDPLPTTPPPESPPPPTPSRWKGV